LNIIGQTIAAKPELPLGYSVMRSRQCFLH